MADNQTFWEKVKDYVGIGLTKVKEAGREPETNLHDVVSKVGRSSTKKKTGNKKK